jgi:hypothetical protein
MQSHFSVSPLAAAQKYGAIPFAVSLALMVSGSVSARAQLIQPGNGPGITFSSLTGANGSAYNGDSEGDFTVTPTAGSWYVSQAYGAGPPSIYVGPVGSPAFGALVISDSAGPFTLSSFEYSCNNGQGTFDVEGYLGSTLEYDETGTLSQSSPPGFGFATNTDSHASTPIDGLIISFSPGAGTTSINLDDIGVQTIPEPAALALVSAGLALVYCGRGGLAKKKGAAERASQREKTELTPQSHNPPVGRNASFV